MSARRLFSLIAIVLVAAAGLYSLYWFHVAGELRKGLERWSEQHRAAGWSVSWQDASLDGFPGAVQMALSAPRIETPSGIVWSAQNLSLRLVPWQPNRFRIAAPGQQSLDALGHHWDLVSDHAGVEVAREADGRVELDIIAQPLTLTTDGQKISVRGISALIKPLTDFSDTSPDTDALEFSLTAQGIVLPSWPILPLPPKVALFSLAGHIRGTLPDTVSPAAIAAWSEAGGTVEIQHLALEWAPIGLEGSGTVALDPQGQPLAAFSTKVSGLVPFMDRLQETGTLSANAATSAKLMLSVLSRSDHRGRSTVELPMTIQDGGVMLGPVRVAAFPPISW